MSSLTYGVGSVIRVDSAPDGMELNIWEEEQMGDRSKEEKARVLGLAVVVVKRDGWVITTEIQPVIYHCGVIAPAEQHLNDENQCMGQGGNVKHWGVA